MCPLNKIDLRTYSEFSTIQHFQKVLVGMDSEEQGHVRHEEQTK